MKKVIIKYYCDLCESEIITTEQEEPPRVRVQSVEESIIISGEKRTYLRNADIHICEKCMETYINRLPLKYDGGNNKPVWRNNPKH